MGRAVFWACLPWLAMAIASCACLWLLVRVNRGRIDLRRVLQLHRNQVGAVQSLSLVLTLFPFVLVLLFIVQVSQLMIGTVMVHYAAYASARAAIVWIPARLDTLAENCVDGYSLDPEATDQVFPATIPGAPNFAPTTGGLTFLLTPGGTKYEKIASAAWMALMPVCPSRDLGLGLPGNAGASANILKQAYQALATNPSPGARLDGRLENKLAYAMQLTDVQVRFFHGNAGDLEPPLVNWGIAYTGSRRDIDEGSLEFRPWQEIGWQDPITVKVTHYFALLPGIGRFLAEKVQPPRGESFDETHDRIQADTQEASRYGLPQGVYVRRLTASCTLGNEGEKSVIPYVHQPY